jgi:pimeloyl-ACP methyl ester carboxylesterase
VARLGVANLRRLILVGMAVAFIGGCGGSAGETSRSSGSAAPTVVGSPTLVPFPKASPGSTTCEPDISGVDYNSETCQLESPSLAANLLDEPGILHFSVLTPVDYKTSGVRYPTVYYLDGAGGDCSGFDKIVDYTSPSLEPAAGSIPPIIVCVSGGNVSGNDLLESWRLSLNVFGLWLFANSPVSGNGEDAITNDLISYVDAHYRTIAAPASRAITGYSVGGAAAINIGLRHPDVFGVLYAMSPSIFEGETSSALLDPKPMGQLLDLVEKLANVPPGERAERLKAAIEDSDIAPPITFAYGTTFAPDPDSPILMKVPFKRVNGVLVSDDSVLALWTAGWGNYPAKVSQYQPNLNQFRAIGVDHGTDEGSIPESAHLFVTSLASIGIKATENTFPGGHTDNLPDRYVNYMLPFVSEHLADGS